MTILKHELKRGLTSFIIWSAAVASILGLCVLIYPEMSDQMGEVGDMFSEMGGFSAAFGMDKISFGSFIGFFGTECGNTLGIGGAFFAAMLGISALSKEEKEHTAEFLLTHPVSRLSVVASKLIAVITQIIVFNAICVGVTALAVAFIGEKPDLKTMSLIFTAYFLMQIEISAITFGISAFLKRGGLGIGLGMAGLLYFANIVANLTDKAKFIKYITPFGYTECADIIVDKALNMNYLAVGAVFTLIGIIAGFVKYTKKDIS